jgi:hypothetical protein
LVSTWILIAIQFLRVPATQPLQQADGFFCKKRNRCAVDGQGYADFFTTAPTGVPIRYVPKTIQTVFENDTFIDSYAGAGPEVDKKWDQLLGG